ncbi:NAD-dependent epimerase/dehydratase family protein [Actinokineospora diospyrosa]|uniref:Nucleoside-diphosphate-sugar epimerase n=1 Tax=Actinokineospora diospyrosa TaxID=103728 RepID=A0ABT1ILJ5_9PSEU|nr:NAD-dependent epimerase/dehydratase family protein [Actinokineospora diospyrosa]MCP2273515.1 Nucleoside-diphosphate-sugar epimerase [Actinokineospora diospyrosa]
MAGELVLVTGGSGFLGAHAVVRLLADGYRVRASVRSLDRVADVREMVRVGGVDPHSALSFVAADLTGDAGWGEAVTGCSYVLHVASPFPLATPKAEDALVAPARDGALRVLRAARDAGVRRVVMTSSFAAVGYGHPQTERVFTEETWTNLDGPGITPYVRSKTLAERAAWEFAEGSAVELAVVNPVGIFGPVLGPDYAGSVDLVRRLLDGELPGVPRLSTSLVDVRDVADLHVRAMVDPAAAGQRFIAAAGDYVTMPEMAEILREHLGPAAARVPTKVLANWLVRVSALMHRSLRPIVPLLGRHRRVSHEKATRLLGWHPRPNEDVIIATAESLLRLGLVAAGH